ncbi:MAG: hypothetical protein MJZ98_00600 [Paludibacteraceae bacterium]|nr:hypothetical protein [Paludibacteraceae bacterium]
MEKQEDNRYKYIDFKKICEVYQKKLCNKTSTALALGVGRNTVEAWRKKYPELDEMMNDVEESLIDFSETKLMEKINEGDLTAIIFHLKTKGRKRGYVERVEQEVSVNPFEELLKSVDND